MQGQETGEEFLRCLPERFTAYKAAMFVSLNIDEFSFHKVVGMVKSHETKLDSVGNHTEVNIAVAKKTIQKSKNEDEVIKMIQGELQTSVWNVSEAWKGE